MRRDLKLGITFIDTAHTYGTHEHLRRAKEGWTGKVVIGTKTPASSRYPGELLGYRLPKLMLRTGHLASGL